MGQGFEKWSRKRLVFGWGPAAGLNGLLVSDPCRSSNNKKKTTFHQHPKKYCTKKVFNQFVTWNIYIAINGHDHIILYDMMPFIYLFYWMLGDPQLKAHVYNAMCDYELYFIYDEPHMKLCKAFDKYHASYVPSFSARHSWSISKVNPAFQFWRKVGYTVGASEANFSFDMEETHTNWIFTIIFFSQ